MGFQEAIQSMPFFVFEQDSLKTPKENGIYMYIYFNP